jgi:hypothetical protein
MAVYIQFMLKNAQCISLHAKCISLHVQCISLHVQCMSSVSHSMFRITVCIDICVHEYILVRVFSTHASCKYINNPNRVKLPTLRPNFSPLCIFAHYRTMINHSANELCLSHLLRERASYSYCCMIAYEYTAFNLH